MQLPNSANACLAWFCANTGFVNISSANTTPTVSSMIDKTSGLGAVQTTVANQPTFVGSTYGVPSSYPTLAFNGSSANLTFDSLSSEIANGFTVFVAASTSVPATANMDLLSFGKAAADGYIQMFISSSKAGFSSKNDAAAVVAPATAGTVDTAMHLYTLVYLPGNTLTLRLDGTQIVQAGISGVFSVNTCTIGALRNNSSTSRYLNGNIAEIAVYAGQADLTAVENYFSNKYLQGLNREV